MIKLGLIGHPRTINIISKFFNEAYNIYETTSIPFISTDISSIIQYVKENEHRFDGLVFTGKIPYELLNTAILSKKPWVYIRRNTVQLVSTLLEAALVKQYDIKQVSIDAYTEDEVYRVYSGIQLEKSKLNLYISKQQIFSDDFLTELNSFHEKNYQNNNVSFCITGVSSVYEYLSAKNIPCMILDPTEDSIGEAMQLLQLKFEIQKHLNSQIVVISIERDLPNEYALVKENEYQLALETMKISEEIYLFAQRVQAAVIEQEMGKYLLFTTKSLLEIETEKLQQLTLINTQNTLRFGTISVGIGYGETAREAKYNANLGLLKAKKNGGNQAYMVHNNNYFGPISPAVHDQNAGNDIDGRFQTIAADSGLSINSILKLQNIFNQQNKDSFTTKELATLYGVTIRSMDRLIEKLSAAGYVKIVGSNIRSSAGRPSRILKFKFYNI